MKKHFLLFATSLVLLSCSRDAAFEETEIQEINLSTIVQPETARALATFDTQSNGIYRGILATQDISYHGELTVNLGNDGNFNAMLKLTNGTKMGFVAGNALSTNINTYTMKGPNGKFTINVTDPQNPVMSNIVIAGIVADAVVLKENSASRMAVRMGTYVDSNNASNFGTWDLISNNTEVISLGTPLGPVSITVNVIESLVVMKNGGGTYTDSTMELFNPADIAACTGGGGLITFPPGDRLPFFTNDEMITLPIVGAVAINEFLAPEQSSMFAAVNVNWNFVFSKAGGDVYYDAACVEGTTATWSTTTGSSGTTVKL